MLTQWWARNRGPDADRMALAQKQFDFYATELKEENPFSKENDVAAVERARAYLKQFAGAERVYAFMLAEAGKNNPPIDYNRQFPGASQAVTQTHIVPGAFSKGGCTFMKDAIAHADRYFNGEQWVLGDQVAGNIDRAALSAGPARSLLLGLRQAVAHLHQVGRRGPLCRPERRHRRNSRCFPATSRRCWSCSRSPRLIPRWTIPPSTKIFQSVQAVVPPGQHGPLHRAAQSELHERAGHHPDLARSHRQSARRAHRCGRGPDRQQCHAGQGQRQADGAGFHVSTPRATSRPTSRNCSKIPITYLDAMLQVRRCRRNSTPAAKSLCGGFRPLLNKYPFNSGATSEATLADVNTLFHKPDGMLWTFFDQKLQKVLARQGTQYVPNPASKVTVNPAFLSFFNAAAAFGETLYADGCTGPPLFLLAEARAQRGSPDAQPARGRPDADLHSGTPAAFKKFTWQGSGAHEAMLSVRFGNTDLGFARGEGLWAAFHLFQ